MNPADFGIFLERTMDDADALPAIRQFLLDLAVRGKLVEQRLADEPARHLLERADVGRQLLEEQGTIRRRSATLPPPEGLFPVPLGWTWCRLSDLGAIVGGGTPSSTDPANFTTGGAGIPWLTPADLGKHGSLFISHGGRDLTAKGLSGSSATLLPKGSVLFTSRAPIGYTAIAENEITTNQGFKSVVPYVAETNLYIATYFRAFAKWIDDQAPGTTFREVSGRIVAALPVPLPPVAEQQRIVARLEELLAVCDRISNLQAKRNSIRRALRDALFKGAIRGAFQIAAE